MPKKTNKPPVQYYIYPKKRPVAGSSRDTYYTINMLLRMSTSWDNLYKKLKYYSSEKAIFDIYRDADISWNNLRIIAKINEG